jgi:universal stress protein E
VSIPRWKLVMVVVTDPFAREQLAAEKAAAVARKCKSKIVLFNAFMVPQPVSDVSMGSHEQIIEAAVRQRREQLACIAARLKLPASTQCIARWDYPIHEAVVRQVQQIKPDVLIAESHRHGRLARIVLANTDWQLMRDCPCPLWFVRSAAVPKRSRWLVAVDPRHAHAKPAKLDERLLRAAQGAVQQLGGSVSVAHAYETPPTAIAEVLLEPVRLPRPTEQTREFVATTARTVLNLAARHGIAAEDCVVREGETADVLAAEAKRLRADVLVMGAVSRSLVTRPVIGATAERVIDHVDCDVFVVKPAGFKAPVRRSAVRGARSRAEPHSRYGRAAAARNELRP